MLWRFEKLTRWLLFMQVRTRLVDEALLAFVAGGGRQVLLLGAGYDFRAARFATQLDGAVVYEVDHPATQAHKRAVVGDGAAPHVRYLPWDFEQRGTADVEDVGMPRTGDLDERSRSREGVGEALRVGQGDEGVVRPVHDQGRHGDAGGEVKRAGSG